MASDYEWVSSEQRLGDLCEHWRGQPYIVIDTEFMRQTTFYPIASLIQVADDTNVYLIDPLSCNLAPLADVLTESSVIKVLHAPSEDLAVFQRELGCLPTPLFDTQVAAGLAGLDGGADDGVAAN